MAEEEKEKKQEAPGKEVGKVAHYYSHLGVGVVELTGTLKAGDRIRIRGHTTDFEQDVGSMQIENERVDEAKAGQSIGLKVNDHVRQQDTVYKL